MSEHWWCGCRWEDFSPSILGGPDGGKYVKGENKTGVEEAYLHMKQFPLFCALNESGSQEKIPDNTFTVCCQTSVVSLRFIL